MQKSFSKILLIISVGLSAVLMQGCEDTDVALGAGIIIGTIISDPYPPHHHHVQPPRYPVRPVRPGPVYPPHRWGLNVSNVEIELSPVEKAALRYEISEDAAGILMNTLSEVKNGNIKSLDQVGLTKEDLQAMAQGENPTASALMNMSAKLNLELGDTHALIQDLKADMLSAKAK